MLNLHTVESISRVVRIIQYNYLELKSSFCAYNVRRQNKIAFTSTVW